MTSSSALITIARTPSDIGRVTRKPKCNTRSLSLSPSEAAILRILPTPSRIVFPFKQSYFRPVNGPSSPWRIAEKGARHELRHRAYHRSAPEPGAHAWLRRFAAQAGHGLHQLEARARTAQRYGHAQAPGRRPARPTSRSCRGDRRPGQYRHAGRVPARSVMDGDVGRAVRRQLRARQSRRLCAGVHADACDDVRALGHQRRRASEARRPTRISASAARSRSSA